MDQRLSQGSSSAANRTAILAAARRQFGDAGYFGATLRSVAKMAGVDPRLIRHYFHSKAELFRTAVDMESDIESIRARILAGDRDDVGKRLAREFFLLWTASPESVRALVAGAMSYPGAAEVLRAHLVGDLLAPLIAELDVDQSDLRAALVGSHLLGVALLYHLVPVAVLHRTEVNHLADAIGPELQRLLTGEL